MNYEESLNIGFKFIDRDILAKEFIKLVEIKTGLKHIKTVRDSIEDDALYRFYFIPVDNSVLDISKYYLKEKLSDSLCDVKFYFENQCYSINIITSPVTLYKNIANLLN